jgi:hypothetical protein
LKQLKGLGVGERSRRWSGSVRKSENVRERCKRRRRRRRRRSRGRRGRIRRRSNVKESEHENEKEKGEGEGEGEREGKGEGEGEGEGTREKDRARGGGGSRMRTQGRGRNWNITDVEWEEKKGEEVIRSVKMHQSTACSVFRTLSSPRVLPCHTTSSRNSAEDDDVALKHLRGMPVPCLPVGNVWPVRRKLLADSFLVACSYTQRRNG